MSFQEISQRLSFALQHNGYIMDHLDNLTDNLLVLFLVERFESKYLSGSALLFTSGMRSPVSSLSNRYATPKQSIGRAEEKISKYDERDIQGEWSTRVSRRSRKRQRRLSAMRAALEPRLYQKEKNKHRQNDPKKVGRGAKTKERAKELRLT